MRNKGNKMAGRIEAYLHSDSSSQNKGGALVEVACETEFAAKTDVFVDFAKKVAKMVYAFGSWKAAVQEMPELEDERKRVASEIREVVYILKQSRMNLTRDSIVQNMKVGCH
jgi:translation elongation factor EF-Ts